jgi:hypothetical protein
MDDIQKIVRAHTEALAHSVADIATNSDQIADDLGEAFADFADSLASEAEKARRRRRRKPTPEDGDDTIPPETPGALARVSETAKRGIFMKDDFKKVAKDIAEAGGAGEVSQSEFVELGKTIYGDKEFRQMMVEDRTIQGAISALHKRDIQKWAVKAHGYIPQAQINVADEIAKAKSRGGAPRGWPHVDQKPHVSESIAGVPADLEAMIARELKNAPWLSVEAATHRCLEAVRASERAADRKAPRQLI